MSSLFGLCSTTFQTWEQLIWIVPLDPDHIYPQQFISFQWMIPFWLRTRCLQALLSPSAFMTYFRCQNTFIAMSHCSVLPACAGCFNGRTAWKMWGTTQNFRFFSSQWGWISFYWALLTYFTPAARSSLTFLTCITQFLAVVKTLRCGAFQDVPAATLPRSSLLAKIKNSVNIGVH